MVKLFTLCFLHQSPRILLGLKKVGFGAGRWNGFGGKVQPGETIEVAARREMKEESGVEVGLLAKRGILNFTFQGEADTLEVHVFETNDFIGRPTESDEMIPKWFTTNTIPFDQMWADDRYWFPFFLAQKPFSGHFLFSPDHQLLEHKVEEMTGVF